MAINKYGLDESEIEALEGAGLSDDEINAANTARVKSQLESDAAGCVPGTDLPTDSIGASMGIGQDGDEETDPMKMDTVGDGLRAELDKILP